MRCVCTGEWERDSQTHWPLLTHTAAELKQWKTNISRDDKTWHKPETPKSLRMSHLVNLCFYLFFYCTPTTTTTNFSTASLHICHFSSPQRLQTAAQTRTGHCSLLRKSKGIFPVSKGQAGTRAQCTVSPGQMALHHFRQSGCTRQADQTMSKWIWCFSFFLSFFLGSRLEQPLMIFSQLYLSATSDRHRVFLIDRFECASRTLRRPSRIRTKAHTMPTHAAFEAFNFLGFDSNSFFFRPIHEKIMWACS